MAVSLTPQQSPLFSLLVAKYGLNTALALLPILDPNASGLQKGLAGTSLAASGASTAGQLGGYPWLSAAGQGLGTALGLASAGYGAYGAATNPNYSRAQQVGHSGRAVTDAILGVLVPYYGLARAVGIVGQQLQRSGSPQIRGTGRALDQAVEPAGAKAFWSVAQGDKSPKAALTAAGPEGLVTDLLGPLGAVLKGIGVDRKVAKGIMDYGPIPGGGKLAKMLGIGSPPTQGTQFRDQVNQLFSRIPALKGTDTSQYNIDPAKFDALNPAAKTWALSLAKALTPLTSAAEKNPDAYTIQLQNILLNKFGNDIPQMGMATAAPTAATGGAATPPPPPSTNDTMPMLMSQIRKYLQGQAA
jgi:hypothetical protein